VIFITAATCAACGTALRVQEERRGYPATGDLFIDLADPEHPKISANCKNIRECNARRQEMRGELRA
jgi:hypothetical protein